MRIQRDILLMGGRLELKKIIKKFLVELYIVGRLENFRKIVGERQRIFREIFRSTVTKV